MKSSFKCSKCSFCAPNHQKAKSREYCQRNLVILFMYSDDDFFFFTHYKGVFLEIESFFCIKHSSSSSSTSWIWFHSILILQNSNNNDLTTSSFFFCENSQIKNIPFPQRNHIMTLYTDLHSRISSILQKERKKERTCPKAPINKKKREEQTTNQVEIETERKGRKEETNMTFVQWWPFGEVVSESRNSITLHGYDDEAARVTWIQFFSSLNLVYAELSVARICISFIPRDIHLRKLIVIRF